MIAGPFDSISVPVSDWPPNVIPAGATPVSQTSEDGTYTLKGFYDPATGELHIQEEVQTK